MSRLTSKGPVAIVFAMTLAACAPEVTIGSGARASSGTPPGPPEPNGVVWAADTDVAWTELQRGLTGRFKATTAQNRTIAVSYRPVSNGSALVETFVSSSGKETISVYHRDGRQMMLTHYCAQGNQARLKAVEATKDRVVYSFLDATNVTEEQGVMQRLVIALRPDGFDQESVYRLPTGEQETTILKFFRAE